MPALTDGRQLTIDQDDINEILVAIKRAYARRFTAAQVEKFGLEIPQRKTLIRLIDRPKKWRRPAFEKVMLREGFRCLLAFETHPQGLCRHLAVAIESNVPHATPEKKIVEEKICPHFGMKNIIAVWPEEYEPNKIEINIISLEPILQ
jgi:hypothetical protein